MTKHPVVSKDEWTAARQALLAEEKAFSKQRENLAAARRNLPWEKVDKDYVFHGPNGEVSLGDLFDGRSQLITYHFMLGPDWEEGCPGCSYLADHFDGALMHLPHRDVTLVVVGRAPFAKLDAYKKRMGWNFPWLSSHGSDFNYDFQVSFAADDVAKGKVYHNYEMTAFPMDEAPGVSVFFKDENGDIFHTYSSYARGLDNLIGAYHFLDLVPKGRDETGLDFPMAWMRRHDQYDD